jgi:hypothetical protein
MVDPGVEVTKVNTAQQLGVTTRSAANGLVALVTTAWKSQTLPANRGYARGMCEGIAVRAGELSLCAGRICVGSAGGAYALALLAIGALGASVSLSEKTHPGGDTAERAGEQP